MEWISVEDELPKEQSWVLVYADGAMNCMAYYKGEWKEWTSAQAHNIVIGSITHWMPLPDKPIILNKKDD